MKRFIAILLVLSLLPCLPVLAKEKNEALTRFFPGDVDGNGVVNAVDALRLLQYSVGNVTLSEASIRAAQTDERPSLDAVDALNILKTAVDSSFVMPDGRLFTVLPSNAAYYYWDVVQDNMSVNEQAWVCETYQAYQEFMALGYVEESQRRQKTNVQQTLPELDEAFFETHGVVFWYRPSNMSTGSLHWTGSFAIGDTLYVDVVPYGTDALDERNAWDSVYSFYYEKGQIPIRTVCMRKTSVGPIRRYYSYAQFDF